MNPLFIMAPLRRINLDALTVVDVVSVVIVCIMAVVVFMMNKQRNVEID